MKFFFILEINAGYNKKWNLKNKSSLMINTSSDIPDTAKAADRRMFKGGIFPVTGWFLHLLLVPQEGQMRVTSTSVPLMLLISAFWAEEHSLHVLNSSRRQLSVTMYFSPRASPSEKSSRIWIKRQFLWKFPKKFINELHFLLSCKLYFKIYPIQERLGGRRAAHEAYHPFPLNDQTRRTKWPIRIFFQKGDSWGQGFF